jgi:hypothetical protein
MVCASLGDESFRSQQTLPTSVGSSEEEANTSTGGGGRHQEAKAFGRPHTVARVRATVSRRNRRTVWRVRPIDMVSQTTLA